MTDNVFVDTNILVYSRDASESAKQPKALACLEELWRDKRGRVSTQVLNEYYVTVTRKLDPGMSAAMAWKDVLALMAWDPLPVDSGLLQRARGIESRYPVSWWDALIIAAAVFAECPILYSEDLAEGHACAGVKIVNPLV